MTDPTRKPDATGPDSRPDAGSGAGTDAAAKAATVAYPMVHRLRVRWAEADMQGVVFNANYLAWFDIGVTEYFRGVSGGNRDLLNEVFDKLFVVRSTLDYRAPARFDEEVEVCARTVKMGSSSLEIAFAIRRDGVTLVEGSNVYVHTADGRPAPLPALLRERITAYEAGPAGEAAR